MVFCAPVPHRRLLGAAEGITVDGTLREGFHVESVAWPRSIGKRAGLKRKRGRFALLRGSPFKDVDQMDGCLTGATEVHSRGGAAYADENDERLGRPTLAAR
jgi:hypothetical protein